MSDQTLSEFKSAEREFVQAVAETESAERQLSQVRAERASYEREQPHGSPVSPDKFTPMEMANEAQPYEGEIFSSDKDGIRSAAKELQQRRQENAPLIVRQYNEASGPQKGERMPTNQTRTAEEAADDLARLRRAEADAQEVLAAHYLQKQIDADLNQQNAQAPQPVDPQPVAQPDQYQPQPEVAGSIERRS